VVRVIDSETKELIRQIPSEELLAISRRLEAATGLLVDDKV
jgi:flagellar protein FlaG